MQFGIAIPNRRRFLAPRPPRRGTRLFPRLVLRHADAECRSLRRHGRRGDEDLANQARHRRADPVQPHRPGRRHGVRLAEQAGAGADRVRRQHRVSPAGAPWAWARSSWPTWRSTSASSRRCGAARRSNSPLEGKRRKIRLLNPELGLINIAGSDADLSSPPPARRRGR